MSLPTLDVLSLFPSVVRSVLDSSILRRAQVAGKLVLEASDLRSFAEGQYKAVDDSPFGGQQGMLFVPEVLESALQAQLNAVQGQRERLKVVYPSPRGAHLDQALLEKSVSWLATTPGARMCFIAGRYEGIDERIVERWVDLELSLGDFIVTGGELPALLAVDGIVRLFPGVLGDERSSREESFSAGLLEYPQYTKPREFHGMKVPEELVSGHHKNISQWKLRQSLLLTFAYRPDLIQAHDGLGLPDWALELLTRLKSRLDLRT